MTADNYHSKPQREEYFMDSGYYKYHEIYHLLRFPTKNRLWKRHIRNIWICEAAACGRSRAGIELFVTEKGRLCFTQPLCWLNMERRICQGASCVYRDKRNTMQV